jgi:hypothetical protein
MRMTGARLDMADEGCRVFMQMMMVDAAECHVVSAARTTDRVAVHDTPDALVERGSAFRTAYADFDVFDRVVHGIGILVAWSMMSSENRFALFGIMLWRRSCAR